MQQVQESKTTIKQDFMKVSVFINEYLIMRGSDVPDRFFSTCSPIALAFKPIFGIEFGVYQPNIWWETKDGYAKKIWLPAEACNWLDAFYYSTVQKRLTFDPIRFDVVIPNWELTAEMSEKIYHSPHMNAPFINTKAYWDEMAFWGRSN